MAQDHQSAADASLDQVILGPFADGFRRQRLVVHARQHNHWQMGRRGNEVFQRGDPATIGQAEIDQHDVEGGDPQAIDGIGHRLHVRHVEWLRGPCQRISQQPRVARIIFDQQNAKRRTAWLYSLVAQPA